MKAILYEQYGTHDVLALKEVEKPVPGDGEVLVKVQAACVNDWDWGLLTGTPHINRLENGLFRPKKFKILGSDIAGRIEAVGAKVTKFKPGDEVYGDLSGVWGGFAEYALAGQDALALKPAGTSFEDAAAIPQAAMLAVQGLFDEGRLKSGQTLLINGAGGGVGTLGVQIARAIGVEADGVDSADKLETMRAAGFNRTIDYQTEDFTKTGRRYDLILDQKTNRSVFAYPRALSPGGIYVTTGGSLLRVLQMFLLAPLIYLFTKKRMRIVLLKPNKDLAYMNELFEAGKIKPVIDGPFRLEEVPEAFRLFGEGKHKGKIVITIGT